MQLNFSSFMKKLNSKNRHVRYEKLDIAKKRIAPRGFVPVFVGEQCIRYEIPIKCLNSIKFKDFLKQHEEDILATGNGPIRLLCSTVVFESVLNLAKAEVKRHWFLEL